MFKKDSPVYAVLILILLSFAIYLFRALDVKRFTCVIILWTLAAVTWYSWETRGMKKEMFRQTELSTRPFVMIFPEPTSPNRTHLFLRNDGHGPALNIKLEDNKVYDSLSEEPLDIRFATIPVLGVGTRVAAWQMDSKDMAIAVSQKPQFNFKILYEDLNGKQYYTSGKFGSNAITFESTGAV